MYHLLITGGNYTMKKIIAILCVGILITLVLSTSISAVRLPDDSFFSLGTQNREIPSVRNDWFNTIADVRLKELAHLSQNAGVATSSIYHTYQEMTELFHILHDQYPDIMSLTSLGKTYEERDIWMVKLSDNVELDENEPEILLMGAHHGNEKPSYEILIYFITYMVENYSKENFDNDEDGTVNEDIIDGLDNDGDGLVDEDPSEDRVREVLDSREIYLVPMVNPDGVEANTRKNCAPNHGIFGFRPRVTSYGVDLNRNYGYRWFLLFLFPNFYLRSTQYADSSAVYHGPRPFSEIETQVVKNLVETRDFYICLTYHTYSELVLYPWGYTPRSAADEDIFISIGENISDINGYLLGQSIELYPTLGDACDWMYGKHGILAYTIELGKSYAPEDPEVLRELSIRHTGVNLYVSEIAE